MSRRPGTDPVPDDVHIFDTTLRDGSQREGLSLGVADKLAVARLLDEFGVGYIEGGWPGAIPTDTDFFARARTELALFRAVLVAFGATRPPGVRADRDGQLAALLDSGAPVITLVAKAHDRHVELALRCSLEENLAMIRDSVTYLRAQGRRVFLDCEHFFDGHRDDPGYARRVVEVASEAGCEVVVLCDTNGGTLPSRVGEVVREVRGWTGTRLGIHAQDDAGCAVANTLVAFEAGATHVQCTANGYGERVGNADLFAVVAALELKFGRHVLPPGALREMSRTSHAIAEIVNLAPQTHQPYVGVSAFAHKAGLHASALRIDTRLYQHVEPELVGNSMRMLVSGMTGRAGVLLKGRELGYELTDPDTVTRLVQHVKERERNGYTYEAADASFELLLHAELGGHPSRPFRVESWRVVTERSEAGQQPDTVELTVSIGGDRVTATGRARGPVDAMNRALRAALGERFPGLAQVHLVDYKVRLLDGYGGGPADAGSITRVLLRFAGHGAEWTTIGVGPSVLEASYQALDDALSYAVLRFAAGLPARPEVPDAPAERVAVTSMRGHQ